MKRDEVLYLRHQFPYRILWVCKARTVCKGGAELTLSGASDTPACSRCGADHSGVINEIQKREDRLSHEVTHPWGYDTQEQADQRQKDEAAHPETSAWRYDDITSRGTEDERNVR